MLGESALSNILHSVLQSVFYCYFFETKGVLPVDGAEAGIVAWQPLTALSNKNAMPFANLM